jgi:hypothetical protein
VISNDRNHCGGCSRCGNCRTDDFTDDFMDDFTEVFGVLDRLEFSAAAISLLPMWESEFRKPT